jgi:hypothetical protein
MSTPSVNFSYITRRKGQSAAEIEAYLKGEKLNEPPLGKPIGYQRQGNPPLYYTLLTPSHTPSGLNNLSFWNKLESFEDEYVSKRYPTHPSPKGFRCKFRGWWLNCDELRI